MPLPYRGNCRYIFTSSVFFFSANARQEHLTGMPRSKTIKPSTWHVMGRQDTTVAAAAGPTADVRAVLLQFVIVFRGICQSNCSLLELKSCSSFRWLEMINWMALNKVHTITMSYRHRHSAVIGDYSTVALVPPMSTMDVWRGIT